MISVLRSFPVLHTNRLLLRETADADIAGYTELVSDEDTLAYVLDSSPIATEKLPAKLHRNREQSLEGEHYYWSIQVPDSAWFVGFIALHDAKSGKPALSYAIMPSWRRRGIASEAICAVTDFAKEELGSSTVIARTHEENSASIELLRSLSFEEVGLVSTRWGNRVEFIS